LELFAIGDDPPTIYDLGCCRESERLFWADAYGGKEKFVELMYASIAEYYGGARYSEEAKPKIGFINEYYPNPNWRDECYPDSD